MRTPTSALRSKDLLGIEPLTPEEIELILDTAEGFKEVSERPVKKVPALRGQLVINLFMEASTRTRVSFEIAEKRLSADTLNFAASGSAVEKGETLIDTADNLVAMHPNMIVIRHKHPGSPKMLADRYPNIAVINAGDGAHEHPTQALLDAFTIRERLGPSAGRERHHRRRHQVLARGALEHSSADEDEGQRHAGRAADAHAGRDREDGRARRAHRSMKPSKAPTW